MSSSFRLLVSLALVSAATALRAQIGDRSDKSGEVQKPIVPADQIPAAPALTPQEALKSFKLTPGIKLELAAADPLVEDPVAMAFGPDGRMWVVEMRGYMPDLDGTGEDAKVGRIVVLRDKDGDGIYDERTVFVDGLVLPRAILVVGDGVLVGAPPELAYWRDTDGDGKADKKVLVAADYGVAVDPKRPFLANPERAPNSLLWGFDNWIYSAAYTKKFRFKDGEWETGPTIFRGQWGLSQDEFGRLYHGSNSDQLRVDVIFSDYLQRNPHFTRLLGTNVNAAVDQFVWPARVNPGINRGYRPDMLREGRLKEFTAAGAMFIYGGDLFPDFVGSAFVAEPSANFVRRNTVTSNNGVPRAVNAYVKEKTEFIASTDERFRPVNFATGPDGALYIVDFYRGVLQHRISLTSYLRQQSEDRKLADPRHLGRIYRVVPADRPAPRATQLATLTTEQWVGKLEHPNSWWRETAHRLLVERHDATTVPAIKKLAASSPHAEARVHALWILDGIGALDRSLVMASLRDRAPTVRAAAVRLAERFLKEGERQEIVSRWIELAKDGAAPEVQLQAMLSLGETRDLATDLACAEIVRSNPKNLYLRDAFFSGIADRETALLERLVATWSAGDAEANKVISGLARGLFASREVPAIEKLLTLTADEPSGSKRALALLEGMSTTAATTRRPIAFGKQPLALVALSENHAYNASVAKIDKVLTWQGKPGAEAAVKPLTTEQQARFETGKGLFTAICSTCHQLTGRGLDGLAPPLLDSEWVLGPPEQVIRIVLHGVRGPILVAGRTHTGDMPSFAAMDDSQLSSILTYVRREWGHPASPIDPADVKAVREATKGHSEAWSPEELKLVTSSARGASH